MLCSPRALASWNIGLILGGAAGASGVVAAGAGAVEDLVLGLRVLTVVAVGVDCGLPSTE